VQEYDRLAQELSESHPGWEQHENDMDELLGFMSSPAMTHPKFGSKHKILLNAITSNAAAVAEATKRMNGSVKNANRSGSPQRVVSNLQQRIKQASNNNDAWELAKQAALNQIKGLPEDDD